jgi:hypothetical protein
MVTQTQIEKTIGAFKQDVVLQIIPMNFSEETFDKYFESENGLFDWVCDEVKNLR